MIDQGVGPIKLTFYFSCTTQFSSMQGIESLVVKANIRKVNVMPGQCGVETKIRIPIVSQQLPLVPRSSLDKYKDTAIVRWSARSQVATGK